MKINVLLPHVIRKPGGGTKVMYDFANQLSHLGHDVIVYNCLETTFFEAKPLIRFLKGLVFKFVKHPSWYKFDNNLQSIVIPRVGNSLMRDADVLFFTGWSLAYDLQSISASKGRKFNLLQDLEFWTGNKETIIESYLFKNITKLTYSNHIIKYIEGLGEEIYKVSISVDRSRFKITIPIEERTPGSICMMYSIEERKGSKFGLEALINLKEQYPDLKVNLFGVPDISFQLPNGFTYYQTPKDLPALMNESSIFLTPSVWEGYGIPGIEAMHCGCAVVCSNAEGHLMYAKDKDTAIVFEAGYTDKIVEALTIVLSDDTERLRIAKNGNKFILDQKSWLACADELASIFSQNHF